jgi:small conductance mechanosensitive channel
VITEPVLLFARITSATARDWLVTHGFRVLVVLLTVLAGRVIARRLIPPAMRRTIGRGAAAGEAGEVAKRAATLADVLVWLVTLMLVVIGGFLILSEVGYNLAPVITGLGIGGIAIGLGAQSVVKDTINGIFILAENQFRVGDYVTVAGVSGVVTEVNLRRTVLREVDGTVYSVPNSSIQVSSNHTREFSGLNVTVLLSHHADLEKALAVATATGDDLARDTHLGANVIEPPRPSRIESIDEKGVTLRVLGRVKPGTSGLMSFEYRRRLKEAFDGAGLRYNVPPPSEPQAATTPHGGEAGAGRR